MTRGSAYKYLNQVYFSTKNDSYREALSLAISALRPVSREQVEKVWRGEWIECQTAFGEKYNKCSRCGFTPSFGYPAFCASCGSANTGEAVQMVMERLEALYETT